ncbi:STE/STE20 protein kinase [Sphaeroforma arctica JP610]|uniref:STE/STE20 protein kinase n=1 Tax=Sphaeroforma arctica JP610 TaxID=667725 RepID=A0A0L0G740_9EUKA|nr:STE/STE20 protein kinase [Sphaeroforma arctica JP610]KNC84686.1 STE/STE20 protein kinase [Sphaeroforma arctica JP610]|eukprot:XP_014158588.1 STE/STE20 protein kinase [Sphaeroforma arctica JP610]
MQVLGEGFSETEIALIMRESIAGLKHLHKLRKIHRDIKGGNILITETGQVKIADFGVAIPLQNTFAKANTFIGTPYWMAPEVIKGKQYDHTADIWSMGVTAIELAETLPPLASHHPMRVLFSIPNREPAQLKEPGSWSESFAQFIAACLQKEPFKRSSTVELLNHAFITSKNFSPNPLIATITRVKERKLKKQTEEDSGEAFDILQSLVFDDDNAIPGLDTLSCGSVESLGNVSSNSSNLDLIERAIYSESLAATATQSQPNPRSVYKRAQSHEPHTRVAKGDGRGPFARHIQSGRITSGKSMDSVSTPSGNMGRHSGTRSQKGMRTRTHTNESTGSRDSSSSSRLGNLRTASTEFIKTQGGRGSGPSSPISSVYKRSPSSSQGNRMDGLTLRSEDILLSAQRSQKLNGVNTNFQRIRKFERLQESKATTFGIDGGVETVRESPHDRSKWLNECLFRSKETTLTNIATIKCNPVQSTSVRLQNRMPGRVPMSVPTRRRHAPTPRVASSGFMANTMTMAQSGSHLMSQSRTSLV